MIKFEVRDKFIIKNYDSEEEYNNAMKEAHINTAWDYKTFMRLNNKFIINKKIFYVTRVISYPNAVFTHLEDRGFYFFQIQKINILSTKIRVLKKLIRK